MTGAAVPGRGPKAAKGGRVAAAGSGHRARPGRTRQRICVEGLTGGALCPGCPYPEGRPSRSLLTPVPSHVGWTWPPSSHSLPEGPRQEPLSLHFCRQDSGLHIPCIHSALASHCGAEGLLLI